MIPAKCYLARRFRHVVGQRFVSHCIVAHLLIPRGKLELSLHRTRRQRTLFVLGKRGSQGTNLPLFVDM